MGTERQHRRTEQSLGSTIFFGRGTVYNPFICLLLNTSSQRLGILCYFSWKNFEKIEIYLAERGEVKKF
jgi:hypothetical protein